MKLLNTNAANTKIAKTQKASTDTPIRIASLSMMPNDTICPSSKAAGCQADCLVSAGRGRFNNVAASRQAKTDFFMRDQEAFVAQLKKEMHSFIRLCKRQDVQPVFRLNTMSDIKWESLLDMEGEFADAQFYDYTKRAARLGKTPSNYRLVFSYSGRNQFRTQVGMAREVQVPIAVVFRGNDLPAEYLGRKVIDGDKSDLYNVESGECVVGLRAKGKAKHNNNGFVVEVA
jgi:hypothetical protein